MARPADPRKSAAWQRRLQQFTTSGMTVSTFCDREGVSVATFHSWRLKLRPQQLERVSRRTPSVFQPVDLLSERVADILNRHSGVRDLVTHSWLRLVVEDAGARYRWTPTAGWQLLRLATGLTATARGPMTGSQPPAASPTDGRRPRRDCGPTPRGPCRSTARRCSAGRARPTGPCIRWWCGCRR